MLGSKKMLEEDASLSPPLLIKLLTDSVLRPRLVDCFAKEKCHMSVGFVIVRFQHGVEGCSSRASW